MADVDIIIKDLAIEKAAQFNMVELYRTLKAWFDLHEYNFIEKEYKEDAVNEKRNVTIKWNAEKTISDYSKFIINIGISLKNYEIIETKNGKLVDGKITIKFSASIASDYAGNYSGKPKLKLSRAIFDKFISTNKKDRLEKEVKQDTEDIFNKTKSYLNLHKFK
jgi:hypothetical protein